MSDNSEVDPERLIPERHALPTSTVRIEHKGSEKKSSSNR